MDLDAGNQGLARDRQMPTEPDRRPCACHGTRCARKRLLYGCSEARISRAAISLRLPIFQVGFTPRTRCRHRLHARFVLVCTRTTG